MNDDLIKVTMQADTRQFVGGVADATRVVESFGKGVHYIGGKLDAIDQKFKTAGKGMIGAGVGIEAMMLSNVKAAADYEAAMNNVFTIIDRTSTGAKGLTEDVLALSTKYPESASGLAAGLYDIASSGIQAKDSVEVLDVSTKAAAAGLSTTAVASRAITAAMNAYGFGAEKASYISDVLFQTVNLGVLSFEDLAQNMGQWVGLAATAKVPLEDAAGAMAAMTLAGIPAAEASTALAGTMRAFIKPSEGMTEEVKKLGYATPEAMLGALGLKGSIDELRASSGGTTTALGKIFQDAQALSGVLALGANEGENYNKVFGQITDRMNVAGSTQRAYGEQSKSLNMQIKILKNTFNAWRIEMGTYLMPVMKTVTKVLTSLMEMFISLPGPVKQAVAIMTAMSGILMILGGVFVITALKAKLIELAITRVNQKMGTNIPVVGNMTRMILALSRKYGEGIPVIGKYATKLNSSATATRRAATGATVLGGALVAGIMAFAGYQSGVKAARQEVEDFDKSQRSAFESTNDMAGLEKLYDDYVKKVMESEKKVSDVDMGNPSGWMTAWGEGIAVVTGQGSDMMNTVAGQKQMLEQMDLTEKQMTNLTSNAEGYAESLGITKEEAIALANTMGIDLTQKQELFGKVMKDGADATKGSTQSLGSHHESMSKAIRQMGDGTYGSKQLGAALNATSGNVEGLSTEVAELTENQKMLQGSMAAIADPKNGFDKSLTRKRDLVQAAGDEELNSAKKALEAGWITQSTYDKTADKVQATTEAVKLSLADYAGSLRDQNIAAMQWANDLRVVAERAGADVSMELAAMGTEGVELTHLMATGTDAEVQAMKDQIVLNMKLTGDDSARELEAGLLIAAEKGKLGAAATREAIATELGFLVDDVDRISKNYGIKLAGGVNPVLDALGRPMVSTAGALQPGVGPNMTGTTGVYPAADGMLNSLPNSAKIHRGRQLIQWAEPETEGEAFIPLANSKRGRSSAILAEVARQFGYGLTKFADGGFLSRGDVPKPPGTGLSHGVLGKASESVYAEAYERTVKFMDDYANFMTSSGGGGASATGLNPKFLMQYNMYNNALGNILSITSGWRSRATQERLYREKGGYSASNAGAARPGTSKHEQGLAIDHSPHSTPSMRATAATFGLRYPMGNEPWHVQPVWANNGGILGMKTKMGVGVFDQGGTLTPGMNQIYNGTGGFEKLIRADSHGSVPATTVKVAVDMRGAQVHGVEDLEAQIDKAGEKLAKQLTDALRKS